MRITRTWWLWGLLCFAAIPIWGSNVRCTCQFYNDDFNSHYQASCTVDVDFRDPLVETLDPLIPLEPNQVATCRCELAAVACVVGASTIRSVAAPLNNSALVNCATSMALTPISSCHDIYLPGAVACEGKPGVSAAMSIMGAESRGNVQMCGTQTIYSTCVSYADCPVHCEVGPFVSSSACSVTCGPGVITLYRSIVTPPQSGGAPCPPLTVDTPCAGPPCPVDCQVGEWVEMTPCEELCGVNITTYRSRDVVLYPMGTGRTCPPLTDIWRCPLAQPCSNLSRYTLTAVLISLSVALLSVGLTAMILYGPKLITRWSGGPAPGTGSRLFSEASFPGMQHYPGPGELRKMLREM